MQMYKTASDFYNKAAGQAEGDMDKYYQILGQAFPGKYPTEMGAAATEAAIRAGLGGPTRQQSLDMGMGGMQPAGSGVLYRGLTNRR